MLYKELVEQEAVPGNPIRDMAKKSVMKTIRPVPSIEDRTKFKEHLANVRPHSTILYKYFSLERKDH